MTKDLTLELSGLQFANGVQIHPDRKSVLISECAASRIVRYFLRFNLSYLFIKL